MMRRMASPHRRVLLLTLIVCQVQLGARNGQARRCYPARRHVRSSRRLGVMSTVTFMPAGPGMCRSRTALVVFTISRAGRKQPECVLISSSLTAERGYGGDPELYRCVPNALVLLSSDTDLLPALEAVVHLRLGHVEVACWTGFKPLRFPASNLPYCHHLNAQDWQGVVDDWKGRQGPGGGEAGVSTNACSDAAKPSAVRCRGML